MKYIAYRKMQEIPGYQGLLHTHLNYEGHHCDGDLEESQKGQPFYILAYEHKFRRTGLYVLANDGHGQPQIHLANYFTHRPDFCKYFNDHIKPVACTFKRWADQDNVIFGIQSPQGIMSVRIYDPERKHLSPPQFMDNPQEIDVKVDVKKIPKPTLIIVTPDGRMELFKLGH
jgi:hypothetical protein